LLPDDGYVIASDVEDDLALAANIAADPTEGDQDTETIAIDSVAVSAGYPSLLVQCVLSSRVTGAGRGISTGREGPVAPVPELVLPFRD